MSERHLSRGGGRGSSGDGSKWRRSCPSAGVHWYGGLNTHNLDNSHNIAPEKFLLATEACNCPGVMYEATNPEEWWNRAEHLGMGAAPPLPIPRPL